MNYKKKILSLLMVITSSSFAAQPSSKWAVDKINLQHRRAQEAVQLLNSSEGGLISVSACWNENAIIVSGPSQKIQNFVTFIKTQFDVPHQLPGGRWGDNILSK